VENQITANSLREAAGALRAQFRALADVHYLPQVDSTNSWLKAQYEDGAITRPALVLTDKQTAGRGTRGREWRQGGQDIALSLATIVPVRRELDPRLSLAVGAVVAETIESTTGLPTRVKWPNDVLTHAAHTRDLDCWRKVSGTLIETHLGAKKLLVIVGVGVNVNSTSANYPPLLADRLTTLRDALAAPVERTSLASRLSADLLKLVTLLSARPARESREKAEINRLVESWFARDVTAGTKYLLRRAGKVKRVVATRVDRLTGGLVCSDEQQGEQFVTSYTELSAADDSR